VLLFHQQIQLVYTIKWCTVFVDIILKRFEEAYYSYSAFVMEEVAHCPAKVQIKERRVKEEFALKVLVKALFNDLKHYE
jgi:hypothetical protein